MSRLDSVTGATQVGSGSHQYIFNASAASRAIFDRRTAAADASHLMPHLRRGMRVVDFGCGTGSITVGLAAAVAPGEVMGLDVSEAAIAQARAHAQQAGLSNAHFSGVLAHLRDPGNALRLAHRVLRPGGVLAVREPQKEGDWFAGPHREAVGLFNTLLIEDWKAAVGDPFLARRLGLLLRQAGFERVEVTPGCAPALSVPSVWAGAARRLETEPEFAARVVERGWITAEQVAALPEAVRLWAASADSVVAAAECTAIGCTPGDTAA